MDIVRAIKNYNAPREPERLGYKYRNMRTNPFVFMRGTCHLYYDRLPRESALDKAPSSWICGDLHIENFGSYKGDNRLIYFDLNDFDEAVLAPCSWDMVRCLSSILVAAKTLSIARAEALSLCHAFLDGYTAAILKGKARWLERDTAQGMVKQLLDGLRTRTRSQFLDTRTVKNNKQRLIRLDGKKALPVNDQQRSDITAFMNEFASRQANPEFYHIHDVARRIAGTGSLGVDRYVILVEGKGAPDGHYLLDLKQALPSSLAPHLTIRQTHWTSEAHRVVAIQQRVQAVSMAFLQPVIMGKKSYVLRGLQPSEDRVTINNTLAPKLIEGALTTMGELVAWGQLRSSGREGSASADDFIAYAQRKKWKRVLLDVAEACSAQTEQDWHLYTEAYDDGIFSLSS